MHDITMPISAALGLLAVPMLLGCYYLLRLYLLLRATKPTVSDSEASEVIVELVDGRELMIMVDDVENDEGQYNFLKKSSSVAYIPVAEVKLIRPAGSVVGMEDRKVRRIK